jgi:transposase-like protein
MSFSPTHCPNPQCPQHLKRQSGFIKKDFYRVKRLNQYFRRFQCTQCRRTFSSRTFKPDYRQKKMDLNSKLAQLLARGHSLRDSAKTLGLTYRNTYLKFLWLSEQSRLKNTLHHYKAQVIQFDEMESIHHTKCKPLSISLMVSEKYELLEAQVAEIPAKGRLAKFSVKKYGKRLDHSQEALKIGFERAQKKLELAPLKLMSDAKPSYRKLVNQYFGQSIYEVHSRSQKDRHRDRLHEKLERRVFDPMFAVNQKCAKLRSSIRRLTRRSWCTTKKVENLQGHLEIFMAKQRGFWA